MRSEILKQQMLGEWTPLHNIAPKSPKALSQVLAKGLAKEPRDRYPDCAGFARAVLAAVGTPVGAVKVERGRDRREIGSANPDRGGGAGAPGIGTRGPPTGDDRHAAGDTAECANHRGPGNVGGRRGHHGPPAVEAGFAEDVVALGGLAGVAAAIFVGIIALLLGIFLCSGYLSRMSPSSPDKAVVKDLRKPEPD